MSNLLKSKTFQVGGLVIAMAFAFAMMLSVVSTANAQSTTTTVVASGYTYSGVMKAGMSGPGISTLQAALNEVNSGTTIVVDGKFGPATVAAVMKFQASKGLTADGVVGPKTGAALAAATVAVITVPGGFPAGCTSNAGFSMTTGQSCAVSITLPAGCTSTSGYSSTTGVRCNSGSTSTLPAGCTSTSGYSSTTGARCNGGSTTTPTTGSGSLGGDEGDINDVSETSSDDSDVEEGMTGEIFAFEAEIEGDVMVDRVDFYMEVVDSTSASEDADDYFSGASLWVGDEKVADLDVEDFDQDDYGSSADGLVTDGATRDDEYRLRFSGLDLVFSDGDEPEFVLALDANNSIDTDDRAEEWRVSLESDSIRFVDGQGFTGDAGVSAEEDFGFDEEGDGETLELKSSSEDPEDSTLLVEDDDDSEWYDVFTFRLEAEEGDIDLNEVVLTVTTGTHNYNAIVDDVILEIDGQEFNDFDVVDGGTTTADLTFDIDGDLTIDADDEVEVVVKMRFTSSDNYTAGTTTINVRTVSVEGEGADDEVDTETIIGGTHTLSLVMADVDVTSVSSDTNEAGTVGTFSFRFTVEASGDDDIVFDVSDVIYVVLGDPEFDDNESAALTFITGDATDVGGTMTVEEGGTATFTLDVTIDPDAADESGVYRVRLESVAGESLGDDELAGPETLTQA